MPASEDQDGPALDRALDRIRAAIADPCCDESLEWWSSTRSTDDLRLLLRGYDSQCAYIGQSARGSAESGGPVRPRPRFRVRSRLLRRRGTEYAVTDTTCPECGGRGFVEAHYRHDGLFAATCHVCDGTGKPSGREGRRLPVERPDRQRSTRSGKVKGRKAATYFVRSAEGRRSPLPEGFDVDKYVEQAIAYAKSQRPG